MRRTRWTTFAMVAALALVAGACTTSSDTGGATNPSASHEPVTITVWDYYGKVQAAAG